MTAPTPRVAIIGSGFSGLCLGIDLLRAGIRSFTIFEKASRLGGTWRDNTYPGACCDVPSMFYCLSFAQRTDWPRKWSPQSEIRAYMEQLAEQHGLRPHIRFDTEVESARWDEDEAVWRVRTSDGAETLAEVLVSGVGQLHKPYVPDLPGLGSFRGERFHSARWRHDVPLRGRRVGVIGNAASAIQFVPPVAEEAAQLTVFQRTPNWMIPRGDRPYGPLEQWLLAHVPGLAKLYRLWIWARAELLLYPAVIGHPRMSALLERQAREYLRAQIPDPKLRAALTPGYPVGGKRVLISDDYYPALRRENVELVTAGIDRITETGVRCKGGREIPLDVLILATGFDTTHFVSPIKVEGRGGRPLEEVWAQGAEAYLGLTVPGFPNFFLMYGPNTNLGHNSILFMIEAQSRYVRACVERLWREGLRAIEVRPEVHAAYNRRVQEALRGTAWDRTERSWYKNEAGRITNNWPWTTLRYWWETRRVDWSAYHSEPGGGGRREAEPEREAA